MRKLILLSVLMVVVCPFVRSQSSISDVQFTRVPGNNLAIATPLDSVFEVTCNIWLSDSINIARVYLTRTMGLDESIVINTDTLDFLNNSNPDITRTGLTIDWQAGPQSLVQRYYYFIRLEDFNGVVSAPYIKQ